MIPKTIHYCWFGPASKSDLILKCINSWKKYCPDYEIVEWNEDNFDISVNSYVQEAYEAGKWAFVSDYARLWIVYHCGGIYLDTDVELLKPLDEFCRHPAFFAFENERCVATGLGFGACKGHPVVKALLDDYEGVCFIDKNGRFDDTPCPVRNTAVLTKLGLCANNQYQEFLDTAVYPSEYFCPKKGEGEDVVLTEKTVGIHHYIASWYSEEQRKRTEKYRELVRKYGQEKAAKKMRNYNIKYFLVKYGVVGFLKKLWRKVFH